MNTKTSVHKKVLNNGLTVLVHPVETTQKVAVELWYKVGSKDEKTGERGIAHLLEHMIFKGTQKLSETDYQAVVHKLSGDCNAHTSFDATAYEFNVPVHNWRQTFPILADCMRNCRFDQEMLNSEFKVVIQELKRRRDNYSIALASEILSSIFVDHPYHFPIIGFKQDLWNVYSKDLHAFYKKHYIPNNAALVVVGAVDPQEVFAAAEQEFGAIAPDFSYEKEQFYRNDEMVSHSVTLYRDVQQPRMMISYVIPGFATRDEYVVQALLALIGEGKSSRLYHTLVDELQLANWISCFTWHLKDHDILVVHTEPKKAEDMDRIAQIIQQTLDDIGKGIDQQELSKVMTQLKREHIAMLEHNAEIAGEIGHSFSSRGDEHYPFTYVHDDAQKLQADLREFVQKHCASLQRHQGYLLPVDSQGKQRWQEAQTISDAQDVEFLAKRPRKSSVEQPRYAHEVKIGEPQFKISSLPKLSTLPNGLTLLSQVRTDVPLVHISLELKANADYDDMQRQGLYRMVCMLMYEGTMQHSEGTFAQLLESYGIDLSISPGRIDMSTISEHLPKALELLNELLTGCAFSEPAVEKIKEIARAEYLRYLDSPAAVAQQLARETVYEGHPYAMQAYARPEVIDRMTREDLFAAYKKYIVPAGSRMAIVGAFDEAAVAPVIAQTLAQWQGAGLPDLIYPALKATAAKQVAHSMNRDQIVLRYAGLSVDRKHPDYDALLLFDQIFGAGMHSRLFALREQHGIFYSIGGSTVSGASLQPGMVSISAMTTPDHIAKAQELIGHTIKTVIDSITQEELDTAKQVILNDPADWYSTNRSIAGTYLWLQRYGFPFDYVAQRAAHIKGITLEQVKVAARTWLKPDALAVVQVGRVQGAQASQI